MLAAILALSMGASQEFLPNGIWSSPHYGFVLQIDDKRVARYDLADKMCVHSGQMPISAAVGLWGVAKTSVDGRSARLLSSPSQYHFDRLDALPAPCAAPLKTEDPKTNLEVFLATFDAHYPFFAERGIDWAAMKSAARDQLAAGADLFDVLSRIVNALGDGHVALAAGERIAKPDPVYAPGRAPDGKEWTWRSLRNAFKAHFEGPNSPLAGPPKLTANQRVFYGKTKSGAGYVAIMAQGAWRQGQDEETPASEHAAAAGQVLDEIMKELAGVNGMIVDIRVNSGGFDSVSLEIASRFAASQSLAYWKSAKGPDGESPAYAVHVTPSSGAAMERRMGASWEDLMRTYVFGPLGMASAGFGAPKGPNAPSGHRASWLGFGGLQPISEGEFADNPPALGPAGTMHMNLEDYAKFLRVFFAGYANGFLSADSIARLTKPADAADRSYALGWITQQTLPFAKGAWLAHEGSNTMWHAFTAVGPARQRAVVAVCNAHQGGGGAAAQELGFDLIKGLG